MSQRQSTGRGSSTIAASVQGLPFLLSPKLSELDGVFESAWLRLAEVGEEEVLASRELSYDIRRDGLPWLCVVNRPCR